MTYQTTLRAPIQLEGIGLHSGSSVKLCLRPAAANTGITFRRMDIEPARAIVGARYDAVCDTRLGTTIRNEHGVSVATIEHLMAALWGANIDNALVELDAPEVPIMDGSSDVFTVALRKVGVAQLSAKRKILRIRKNIHVRDGQSAAHLSPHTEGDEGLVLAIEVDYESRVIGRQSAVYDFREAHFESTLSRARTFGFEYEVAALQRAGLALGGSLDNAIVVGETRVLNADGLRFDDEFVRHKALDCVGDLFLAGLRIDGIATFARPGHSINNQLLRALLSDESAYEIADSESAPYVPVAPSQRTMVRSSAKNV